MPYQWYIATIILRCRVADEPAGPWTCDEQLRLVRAADAVSAYAHAIQLGHHAEQTYQNSADIRVTAVS